MPMKLGRNFTNLLNREFLPVRERQALQAGKLSVADMDARVQLQMKTALERQVRTAAQIGLDHVEIDGNIPNPYLSLPWEELRRAGAAAAEYGITLSFHLPSTGVAGATASIQEEDRTIAVSLIRRYIDAAAVLGCRNVNMHPGCVPPYQNSGYYRSGALASIKQSLAELVPYAAAKGMLFHLENVSPFDGVGASVEECAGLLTAVNGNGGMARFCFDSSHWLSRVDAGLPVDGIEKAVDAVPAALLDGAEAHLSDYIPGERKYHVPLHFQAGLLRRRQLKALLAHLRDKGVATLIIETVARTAAEAAGALAQMKEEQEYVREVLEEVERS